MQRTPGMAPTNERKKYTGKSLKERDPYLALLLGRLEDDIDAIEKPVEKTVPHNQMMRGCASYKKLRQDIYREVSTMKLYFLTT